MRLFIRNPTLQIVVRIIAVLTLLIATPIYLFSILGILFSAGNIVGYLFLLCSTLTIIWAIISIFKPLNPLLLLFAPPLFYSVDHYDRNQISKSHEKICNDLKVNLECTYKGNYYYSCSQDAKRLRGFNGAIPNCKRTNEQEALVNKHLKEKELVKIAQEKEERDKQWSNPKYIEQKINNLSSLNDVDKEYLNREDVQIQIFKINPLIFRELPKEIELHEAPLRMVAERVYKFSFHLPDHLKSNPLAQKLEKEFESYYSKHRQKFILEALKEAAPIHKLYHPDFFLDQNFTTHFLNSCVRNMYYPYLEKTIYFFKNSGLFHNEHKDTFVKSHPKNMFSFSCYPKDLIDDEEFLLKISYTQPYSNFIEEAHKLNTGTKIAKLNQDKIYETLKNSISRDVTNVKKASSEILSSRDFQEWLFLNAPRSIQYLEDYHLNEDLLRAFIKDEYKPSRYFSKVQQEKPNIKKLLNEYKNEDSNMLERKTIDAKTKMASVQCCGPSYEMGIENIFKELPDEIIQNDEFHFDNIKASKIPTIYIEAMIRYYSLNYKIKDFIVSFCPQSKNLQDLVYSDEFTPIYVKEDSNFHKKLKENCLKKNKSK